MINYTYENFKGSKTSGKNKVKAMGHLVEFTILAAVSTGNQISVFLSINKERLYFFRTNISSFHWNWEVKAR